MEDELKPSKLQHYWDQQEYWENSLRPKETCCHSDSSERLSANVGVKTLQEIK